jgi:hypothetical protein
MLCIYTGASLAEDNTAQNEQNRTIHITNCKKIEFCLTLDQKEALLAEREAAFTILSDFCNNELSTLSEKLAEQAPHVTLSLALVNIEEDSDKEVNKNLDDNSEYTENLETSND